MRIARHRNVKSLFTVVVAAIALVAEAEVVSLDGTWQAEVVQDAHGDALPVAFTRTIPVPGHWPLTRWESAPGDKKPWVEIDLGEERDVTSCKIHWFRVWKKPPAKWRITPALPARTRYIFVEISDISPNKLASIEEIEIH